MAAKKKKSPAKKRKSNKRKTKQQKSLFGSTLKWLFVLGLWAGMFVVALCAWYAAELPSITQNADFQRKTAIIVKSETGDIIGRYGDIVGNKITVDDVPQHLIDAVLAIEDRRFYYHFGIDPIGFARAMFVNVREQRFAQGGSTITQQLAKNLFLSRERTIKRKIQEAMLAVWLEYELTKDEILSAYLNRVYLGGGTYGVDAASQLYFKKPVTDITLREAATLAGLLKAPSRYSPLKNPTLSKKRTDVVIAAMDDAGYINAGQKSASNNALPTPPRKPSGEAERYYADWIVDEVNDLIGTPNTDIIVETTMNPEIQTIAEDALASKIREVGEEKNIAQGAVVVMRPNGAVVALVGGKDYAESQFNRATQARRQPGSSFKPIVYLTALENGWRPADLIMDEPITRGRYRPKNFGNKYYGEVTLIEAITLSLNTVAYQLIKELGPAAVVDTARRLGIESELNPDLSLALGTNIISPLELTGAYASIANGGVMVKPYGITKITTKDDDILLYERTDNKKSGRAVSPGAVGDLITMMESVIQNGTGRGANFGGRASGKTGTSQDSRDAWFIGFTDRLVTSVWLGNDDNSPMKRVTGGSYPAQIWRTVMAQSNRQYAPFRYDVPFFSGFHDMLARWRNGGNKKRDFSDRYDNSWKEGTSSYSSDNNDADNADTGVPDAGRYNN